MTQTLAHLGRIDGMPHEEYLRVRALSNSGLKRVRKSPFHYRAVMDGEHPETEGTREMLQGTVTHARLLEPETFDERFPVGPEVSKNSNSWKAFVGLYPNATVIDKQMRDVAEGQAASLRSHPEVARLFDNYPGASEVSIFWIDDNDLYCKARIDRVFETSKGVILFDLKTGRDMTLGSFRTSAARLGYAHQAWWYTRGWERVTGQLVLGFVIAGCEQAYPYATTVFMFKENVLARAGQHCTELMEQVVACERKHEWPGYPTMQLIDSLPNFAYDAPWDAPRDTAEEYANV